MKIFVYECGLREGAQAKGVAYSVEDKLKILKKLDEMGVDYVEGGNPASNPKDSAFFKRAKQLPLRHTKLCAFGSTCRVGIPPERDPGLKALLEADTPVVTIFGKSWDLHVRTVLHTSLEENLEMIRSSIRFLKQHGKEVIFDAEHFFDGYMHHPAYAMETLEAACRAGADAVTLCDTNGGAMGIDFYNTVRSVVKAVDVPVGVHCHNDTSCADSNTIIGVQAGAKIVQTSILGLGERCGNANFFTVVPNLQLKLGFDCITSQAMEELCDSAGYFAELVNSSVPESAPYVGKKAFSHKAGMHIDAIQKDSRTFEHIDPALVGNQRQFLVSEISGGSAVVKKIQAVCPGISKNSPETEAVLQRIKELEYEGYQFEGADASFELVVKKALGMYRSAFELDNFKVVVDEPSSLFSSVAMVKIEKDGQVEITAAEGNGPVNALDKAIRKALEVFYPQLKNVRLADYKVRVLSTDSATASKVRVLIETTDGRSTWSTVGVSEDIIKASFKAVTDSLEYYLNK